MACTCRTTNCPHCDSIVYPGTPIVAHPVVSAMVFHKDAVDLGEDNIAGLVEQEVTCQECKVPFWFRHERECVEAHLDSLDLPHHKREGFLHRVFGGAQAAGKPRD